MARIFILNPGDGCDVLTMRNEHRAISALAALRKSPGSLAVLYSYLGGVFCEWHGDSREPEGEFYPTETSNLPVKVIEAAAVRYRRRP